MTGTGLTVSGMGWQRVVVAEAASHMMHLALCLGHKMYSQPDGFTPWPPCPGAVGCWQELYRTSGERKGSESILAPKLQLPLAADPRVLRESEPGPRPQQPIKESRSSRFTSPVRKRLPCSSNGKESAREGSIPRLGSSSGE